MAKAVNRAKEPYAVDPLRGATFSQTGAESSLMVT